MKFVKHWVIKKKKKGLSNIGSNYFTNLIYYVFLSNSILFFFSLRKIYHFIQVIVIYFLKIMYQNDFFSVYALMLRKFPLGSSHVHIINYQNIQYSFYEALDATKHLVYVNSKTCKI